MSMPWYRLSDEDAVASPSLLIYPDRIEENIRRMIALAGSAERLRPHVKTHKLPQVVEMHLRHGIRKFKAATIAEAEMTAAAGASDILLAYPAIGPNASRLATLACRFPQVRFRAIADCDTAVDGLAAAARSAGIRLEVLLDLDVGMHRTGITPGVAAGGLYQRIAQTPELVAGGLHAYDGHLHDPDHAALEAAVDAAFAPVWKLRDDLVAAGLPVPLVVAGGTPTSPILARHGEVEVGAGTTVLWDCGQPRVCPDLEFLNAAVLLCRVVSRPTPGRLCLDLGHKAVASEMPHPRVQLLGLEDATFVMHSEEHLVVETPLADDFPVGTAVYALPRHVCPSVALHAEAVVVEQGRVVDRWPVTARARRITV
jgi:D-serine deaminase-like pyridoxal phosphate-dependent protein